MAGSSRERETDWIALFAAFGVILPSLVIIVIIAKRYEFIDERRRPERSRLRAAALGCIGSRVLSEMLSILAVLYWVYTCAVLRNKCGGLIIYILFLFLGIGRALLARKSSLSCGMQGICIRCGRNYQSSLTK